MVELKTSREIGLMRDAGHVVAKALAAVCDAAAVGVTLAELDQVASSRQELTPYASRRSSQAPAGPAATGANVLRAAAAGVPGAPKGRHSARSAGPGD